MKWLVRKTTGGPAFERDNAMLQLQPDEMIIDYKMRTDITKNGRNYYDAWKDAVARSTENSPGYNNERYNQLTEVKNNYFPTRATNVRSDEFMRELLQSERPEQLDENIGAYLKQVVCKMSDVQYTTFLDLIDTVNQTLQLCIQPTLIAVSSVAGYLASSKLLGSPEKFKALILAIKKSFEVPLFLKYYTELRNQLLGFPKAVLFYSAVTITTLIVPAGVYYYLSNSGTPQITDTSETSEPNRRVVSLPQENRVGGAFSEKIDEIAESIEAASTDFSILMSSFYRGPLKHTLGLVIKTVAEALGMDVQQGGDQGSPPTQPSNTPPDTKSGGGQV